MFSWAPSIARVFHGRAWVVGEGGPGLLSCSLEDMARPLPSLRLGPCHQGQGSASQHLPFFLHPSLLKLAAFGRLWQPGPRGVPLAGIFPWELAIGRARDGAGVWALKSLCVWTESLPGQWGWCPLGLAYATFVPVLTRQPISWVPWKAGGQGESCVYIYKVQFHLPRSLPLLCPLPFRPLCHLVPPTCSLE